MADIEYRCVKCKAVRIASEFADAAKLKCPACGESLRKPGALDASADGGDTTPVSIPSLGGSRLKLSKPQPDQRAPESPFGSAPGMAADKTFPPSSGDNGEGVPPLDLHPRVKRKIQGPSSTLLAFLLFAMLGSIMGYLRYAGIMEFPGREFLPQAILDNVLLFAWAGILAINLVVVVRAMNDNMFQGILCLLVPGWSVVYLLFISDNFYLRAVVFGLLVGIAQDGSLQLYEGAAAAMNRVSAFIDSGGGELRRAPERR